MSGRAHRTLDEEVRGAGFLGATSLCRSLSSLRVLRREGAAKHKRC
jgi:hypothetical protein